MKVGADPADDLRRGKLIRSIIDDPQYLPPGKVPKDPDSEELKGKNAGPTGSVLMIDANQVWDVNEAIEYVGGLREIKPWSVFSLSYLLIITGFLHGKGSSRSQRRRTISWDTLRSGKR